MFHFVYVSNINLHSSIQMILNSLLIFFLSNYKNSNRSLNCRNLLRYKNIYTTRKSRRKMKRIQSHFGDGKRVNQFSNVYNTHTPLKLCRLYIHTCLSLSCRIRYYKIMHQIWLFCNRIVHKINKKTSIRICSGGGGVWMSSECLCVCVFFFLPFFLFCYWYYCCYHRCCCFCFYSLTHSMHLSKNKKRSWQT